MKFNSILIFTVLLLIFSCGDSNNKDQLMKEALDIHNQTMAMEKEILPKLEELEQAKNSINIQGRALTDEEKAFVRKVELLNLSLEHWQENHIEVPGAEHDHTGHDHNHGPKVEFTPEDMLIIQKEFKDSMMAIKARLEAISLPGNAKDSLKIK